MFDTPVILNLHYFKRDSYISVICQAAVYAAEDKKADAVAHLASARSQNTGNGILGTQKNQESTFHTESAFFIRRRQRQLRSVSREETNLSLF